MFDILRSVVGPKAFDAIVGGYYSEHHAAGGTTDEFVREAIAVAGPPVGAVFEDWLFTTRCCEILASGAGVRAVADSYGRGFGTRSR